MTQLYSCQAEYHKGAFEVEVKETGELITIEKGVSLTSYSSVVAIYDCCSEVVYFLPRSSYSNTTRQHVRKFCKMLELKSNSQKDMIDSGAAIKASGWEFLQEDEYTVAVNDNGFSVLYYKLVD